MREITIDEHDFNRPSEFMAQMKKALSLPEWTGSSLAAFRDCLGDISEPTQFTVLQHNVVPETWFSKAAITLMRAAMENENLKVFIRRAR